MIPINATIRYTKVLFQEQNSKIHKELLEFTRRATIESTRNK